MDLSINLIATSAPTKQWRGGSTMSDGSIWFCANDSTFYSGNLFKSTDSGATWIAQTQAGLQVWDGICEASPGVYYATAWCQGVWRSSDFGATWTKVFSSSSWQCRGICASADGKTIFMATWDDTNISASPGRIYYSTDNGYSWTATSSPVKHWWGICRGDDGQILATASSDGIYAIDPISKNVTKLSNVAASICGIADIGGFLYSAGYTGKVYLSIDRGNSVSLVTAMSTELWQGVTGYISGENVVLFISAESGGIYRAVFEIPILPTKIKGTFSGSGVKVFCTNYNTVTFELPISAQTTTELTINKDFIATWGVVLGNVRILVVDGEYISDWKDWNFNA